MTAVMLLGDIPPLGILRDAPVLRFHAPPGPESSSAFVDWAGQALREREAVIAVYPAWRSARYERLVKLARAAHLSDRIAALPLDLPPLALSLLAEQLAFVAPYVRPGVVASVAHTLAAGIHAGAWVSSVARLEHVRTGLGSHLSSYLPGSGFLVLTGTDAGVHRITSAKPVPQLTPRSLDPVIMVAGGDNGDMDWLQNRLKPALNVVNMTVVQAQPLSAEYWGSKKYVEFVAFSGHGRALHSALAATHCRPCGWCGEPTSLPSCPFCSMVQQESPAQPQPHSTPQNAHQPLQPNTHPGNNPQQNVQQAPAPVQAQPPAPASALATTGQYLAAPPQVQPPAQPAVGNQHPGQPQPQPHWQPPTQAPAQPGPPQQTQPVQPEATHGQPAQPPHVGQRTQPDSLAEEPKQVPTNFGTSGHAPQADADSHPGRNGRPPEREDVPFGRPGDPAPGAQPPSVEADASLDPDADEDDDWPGRNGTVAFRPVRNT